VLGREVDGVDREAPEANAPIELPIAMIAMARPALFTCPTMRSALAMPANEKVCRSFLTLVVSMPRSIMRSLTVPATFRNRKPTMSGMMVKRPTDVNATPRPWFTKFGSQASRT
jgi:hypothetical protein